MWCDRKSDLMIRWRVPRTGRCRIRSATAQPTAGFGFATRYHEGMGRSPRWWKWNGGLVELAGMCMVVSKTVIFLDQETISQRSKILRHQWQPTSHTNYSKTGSSLTPINREIASRKCILFITELASETWSGELARTPISSVWLCKAAFSLAKWKVLDVTLDISGMSKEVFEY